MKLSLTQLKSKRLNLVAYFVAMSVVISIVAFIARWSYGEMCFDASSLKNAEVLNRDVERSLIANITNILHHAQSLAVLGTLMYGKDKEVSPDNRTLVAAMEEILQGNPFLESVHTGTESGLFLQVCRVQTDGKCYFNPKQKVPAMARFVVRFVNYKGGEATETWIYEDSTGTQHYTERATNHNYDYRKSPWYKAAAHSSTDTWYDLYVSERTGLATITFSHSSNNEKTKGFTRVFGCSISTNPLLQSLQKIHLDTGGILVLANKQGKVFSSSDTGNQMMCNLHEVTQAACSHYVETKESTFHFKSNKILYVGAFTPFTSANNAADEPNENVKDIPDKQLVIGTICKASEYNMVGMGELKQKYFNFSLLILIITIFGVIFSARRISKPIKFIADEAGKIKNFDLTSKVTLKSAVLEIQQLSDTVDAMRQNLIAFTKFVPKILVRKLLATNRDISIGGKSRLATFLFSDIADFTTICESYPADKLLPHVSDYFEAISETIYENNGIIDKYIGDGVMAIWGAPDRDKSQAYNACKAALAIQKKLLYLNSRWGSQDKPVLHTRIGINIGNAVIGNMGSSERLSYTALGDSVNQASRLEAANKLYNSSIIISEAVFKEVGNRCLARPLDYVVLKGRKEAIKIYELLGLTQGDPSLLPSKHQIAAAELFTQAYQLYHEQRWSDALELFQSFIRQFGDDVPANLHIERCKAFIKSPPPLDWNGIHEPPKL